MTCFIAIKYLQYFQMVEGADFKKIPLIKDISANRRLKSLIYWYSFIQDCKIMR